MSRYWSLLAAAISLLTSTYGYSSTNTLVPRFAYVANNQDDTVSIFAIRGYRLQAVGYVYTGSGSNPRAVVVTPSQAFLYVAEGNAGIAGYAIHNINGGLTPVPGSPFVTGSMFSVAMHPSGKFLVGVSGTGVRMPVFWLMVKADTLFEFTLAVNRKEPVGSIAADTGLLPDTV